MKTLEVHIPEEIASKLVAAAERLSMSVEELLVMSVEEKLHQLDGDFQQAADYVLKKNRELYERLA